MAKYPIKSKEYLYSCDRKMLPNIIAPTLPPAPTIPAIAPVFAGSTNGTIEKHVPQDICTKKEKKIIIPTLDRTVEQRMNANAINPSIARHPIWAISLPLRDIKPPILSLSTPPKPREMRFVNPNSDAIAAPCSILRLKRSTK
eukprot:CAMPEP_0184872352 /NCGR_PEP_ID=MMETSP0580-20130426/41241_1 /TAXON_ID=1118495 /ORGANISM="Dactyliosolen fragilissimus" /LENGTH=142 /DNA_ID=CAMNT_0027375141 /DNA_START=191 /DNA_END=619 /DNA_ORIENTATION=-